MTVKNIIEQAEKMFGSQPEQYMFQLIKDTDGRYVMIPKLADPHKLLRGDTDEADDSLV